MIIKLTNKRQKDIHAALLRHKLPSFFRSLFASADETLDFLQAFIKLRVEKPQDRWSEFTVLPTIRKNALTMTPRQSNRLIDRCLERTLEQPVDLNTVLISFSCKDGDVDMATAKWQQITDASFSEDMFISGFPDMILMVPMLIAASREMRTWPLLAQGVSEGNEASRAAFVRLMTLLGAIRVVPHFIPYSSPKSAWILGSTAGPIKLWEEFKSPGLSSQDLLNPTPVELPVPEEYVYDCNRFYRQMSESHTRRLIEFARLVSWFAAYEEQFQEAAARFWDDIIADTKYGLRPEGRDVVRIDVTGLRGHGYRYIQLFPGQSFPNARAKVWIELELMGRRIYVEHALSPGPLRQVDPVSQPGSLDSATDKLQQFIALHCMWKIMTGRVFRVSVRKSGAGERKRAELERAFLVRPHYRWLVPGHQASERAVGRSVGEFGHEPPPGKTFVKSEIEPERAVALPVDKARPVVTYTDEDLDI